MSERKEKKLREKRVCFLAAAALSAVLIGNQVPVVFASASNVESASKIELEDLFPDNITVTDPVCLAEVTFPENKYGKLKWLDDSIELTERVQSCEALFVPDEDVNLSDMEGWDEELGGIVSTIHVIVSSLEDEWQDEGSEDSALEEEISGEDEDYAEEETDAEMAEDGDTDVDAGEGEDAEGEDVEEDTDSEENKDSADAEEDLDAPTEDDGSEESEEGEGTFENDENNDRVDTGDDEKNENNDTGNEEEHGEEENDGTAQDIEDKDNEESDKGSEDDSDVKDDADNSSDNTENPDDGEAGENDNIFDNPSDLDQEDERPDKLPENPTEEEKIQQAIINHSDDGISVSGINLPWYVQFRVTSGESYAFANESDAAIFQSYEFELWDLQNDTEYEIPDGEYISVTVPVKEGYDYTVEHLLDNGASETIVPSVEGGTMIFSTHSFSPFGIAGSKQLVGPDFPIDDNVKPSVTPTPAITGKPGNGGASNGDGTNQNDGTSGSGTNGTGSGNSDGAGSPSDGGQNGGASNGTGTSANSGISNADSTNGTGTSGTGGMNGQNGSQSSNNGHAVQTGDTTAILPFVILVIAAAVLIGAVIFIKKKKK